MIENNRTALGLLAVLIVFGLGFVWWQFLYKPATAERTTAELTNTSAQSALSDAQARLNKAQQEVDASKRQNGGVFDASIGKLQVAGEAVPTKAQIDDALIVLSKYADRSGIRTSWRVGGDQDAAGSASAVGGAQATNISVTAAGTWTELKTFIGMVESSASAQRGKLHIRGRIFNVVQVQIASPDAAAEQAATASGGSLTSQAPASELTPRKGEYQYKIVIQMYTSSFDQAAAPAATTPGAATDPAAAAGGATGATGATGAPGTTPGATTGTTPGATGAAGTTPATGTSTTGTPATGGATPSVTDSTGGATPTGAGTPTGATTTTGTMPATTGVGA